MSLTDLFTYGKIDIRLPTHRVSRARLPDLGVLNKVTADLLYSPLGHTHTGLSAEGLNIIDLTEDTAPTSDDLIITVNNPGGSSANRKVTLANLFLNIPQAKVSGHSAFGNDAGIDKDLVAPDYSVELKTTMDLREIYTGSESDHFIANQLSLLQIDPSVDMVSGCFSLNNLIWTKSLNSKNYSAIYASNNDSAHYGSGNITQLYCIEAVVQNKGLGHIDKMAGLNIESDNLDAGGSIDTNYGIYVNICKTAGTITTGYGLYIKDTYGKATTAYNIYSEGANSRNWFEGSMEFGTYSAKGAEAFDGYITIKDKLGNVRKLMTCA
jgi:hypothetical protein